MENILDEKLAEIEKLANQGKIKKASELFQKLAEGNPDHLELKIAFADFLLQFGDAWSALVILRQAIKIEPENLNVKYLFAIAQIKTGRFYLAEKELKFLLSKQPSSVRLKKELGWVKIMQGEIKQGRTILREIISSDLTYVDAYMDLGVSFAGTLDFEQAFHWLEIAKNLNPNDPLVLEQIEHIKKIQEEFEKFSEKDKAKIRQLRNDPKYLKEEAIQNALQLKTNANTSQDDIKELKKNFELAGFNPNFGMFSRPNTKAEKEQVEYLEYHQKVPNIERKIPPEEFENLKANLLNPKLPAGATKTILIALGHQGTKQAIVLLEQYCRKAPKHLKTFAQMALQECKMFAQENPGKFISFPI